jgi:hypothetical protein
MGSSYADETANIKRIGIKHGSYGGFSENGVRFFGGTQEPDVDKGVRFENFLFFPLCRFFFTGRNEDNEEGIVLRKEASRCIPPILKR